MREQDASADPYWELREFARNHFGQGTFEEYKHLQDTIRSLTPCRVLIFGLGADSGFWIQANSGGETVFVEHEPGWIRTAKSKIVGLIVHQVTYETRRFWWRWLRRRPHRLLMKDLPDEVLRANWDVIFVDSPQGHKITAPGRMKSIYTASVLARESTSQAVHVLVHDCDRRVERVYTDTFLGAEHLLTQIRTLRHYLFERH